MFSDSNNVKFQERCFTGEDGLSVDDTVDDEAGLQIEADICLLVVAVNPEVDGFSGQDVEAIGKECL